MYGGLRQCPESRSPGRVVGVSRETFAAAFLDRLDQRKSRLHDYPLIELVEIRLSGSRQARQVRPAIKKRALIRRLIEPVKIVRGAARRSRAGDCLSHRVWTSSTRVRPWRFLGPIRLNLRQFWHPAPAYAQPEREESGLGWRSGPCFRVKPVPKGRFERRRDTVRSIAGRTIVPNPGVTRAVVGVSRETFGQRGSRQAKGERILTAPRAAE